MDIGVEIELLVRREAVTDVENLSQHFRLSGEPYANFSFMML